MSDPIEGALTYLEAMGEEGRYALRIAGLVWEESWRRADERARVAERKLSHVMRWALDEGRESEAGRVRRQWEYRDAHPDEPLKPWHEQRIEQRERELHELRKRLEEAIEANHRMARIADRDRLRAETAERECDELRAKLRALHGKGRP